MILIFNIIAIPLVKGRLQAIDPRSPQELAANLVSSTQTAERLAAWVVEAAPESRVDAHQHLLTVRLTRLPGARFGRPDHRSRPPKRTGCRRARARRHRHSVSAKSRRPRGCRRGRRNLQPCSHRCSARRPRSSHLHTSKTDRLLQMSPAPRRLPTRGRFSLPPGPSTGAACCQWSLPAPTPYLPWPLHDRCAWL
jgi:hypothetical protein